MTTTNVTKGFFFAMVSSCTFGMIPLFSLPAIHTGMATASVVFYRFGFGSVFMLILMLLQKENLYVTLAQFVRLSVLAVLNIASAVFLIEGFNHLPSGVATTLQFSYPIFTALIMMAFFHEKSCVKVWIAIALAVGGVAMLSGFGCDDNNLSMLGIIIELVAGLSYAVYLVAVPMLKLDGMDSSKLTFYVFIISTVMVLCYDLPAGQLQAPANGEVWLSLLMLGLITTALSNYSLVVALRLIGSTITAILGALEPLTAMIFGITIYNEPITLSIGIGFAMIVAAVIILVLKDRKKECLDKA